MRSYSGKRVASLDCTRAICMLWIIGFWHMSEYVKWDIYNSLTLGITNGVLATFTLLSGYFIGTNKISQKKDVIFFYKKRLLRFYPLFFLSSTSILIIHIIWNINYINSFEQYILTILGLSFITTPAPMTIWFISMLMFFYVLTPLIIKTDSTLRKIINCIIIFIIFIITSIIFVIDSNLLLLFPFYCAGLVLAGNVKNSNDFNIYYVFIPIIIFLIISCFEKINTTYFIKVLMSATFVVFILQIGRFCTKNNMITRVLQWISYGSMCAYLFHRQILGLVYKIIGVFPVWVAYLIVLPVLLLVSCLMQLMYDGLLNKIKKKSI